MAETTEGERQLLYQADVDIINSIADNKILKLRSEFETTENTRVSVVRRKTEALELRFERGKNAIIEVDMRAVNVIREKMEADVLKVEAWRRGEIGKEAAQLAAHTQRPRRR